MHYLYRSDRAGAQDHFAPGAGLGDFACLNEAHADRAALLDDQAIHQHVFLEVKIGAPQRGLQKTSRGRPTASALLVDVEITDALIVARAMMLAFAQKMILQPPKRRLDVVPTPAAKAKLAPVVVIGGLSAHGDHGVDRG